MCLVAMLEVCWTLPNTIQLLIILGRNFRICQDHVMIILLFFWAMIHIPCRCAQWCLFMVSLRWKIEESLIDMSQATTGTATVALKDRYLVVIGGFGFSPSGPLRSCFIHDTMFKCWSKTPTSMNMNVNRADHTAVVLDERLLYMAVAVVRIAQLQLSYKNSRFVRICFIVLSTSAILFQPTFDTWEIW